MSEVSVLTTGENEQRLQDRELSRMEREIQIHDLKV